MTSNLLRQFLTYGAGNVLQSGLNLILLPLYLRFFAPNEYGVIAVLSVVLSLFTLLMSGGVTNGLVRVYYEAQEEKRRELVWATFVWYVGAGTVGGGMLFLMAPRFSYVFFHTDVHGDVIRMLSIVFFFSIVRNVPLFILRLEKKASRYVMFSLFGFAADFGLKLYFIVGLKRGILGYFESSAFAVALTLGVMIPFVLRYMKWTSRLSPLKLLLRFGVPYIVSGGAMWMLDVSDRLLLAHFCGEGPVGIYALAYNFANIFSLLLATPIALLIDPVFFAYAAERPMEEAKRFLERMGMYFFVLGGVFYLGIALGSGDLLRVFTLHFGAKERYLQAVELVPILTLGPFLYFWATPAGLAALLARRPEITSAVCLMAAGVNVGLNLIVIPRYGALGAASTTVAAYLVLVIVLYQWVGRTFRLDQDWKGMGQGALALVVFFLLCSELRMKQPLVAFFTKVPLSILSFLVFTYFGSGILTREEKNKVHAYWMIGRSKVLRRFSH